MAAQQAPKPLWSFARHADAILAVGFSAAHALSVSLRGEILVWNVLNGNPINPVPPGTRGPESSGYPVFLWKNSRHMAYPEGSTDVVLRDLQKGQEVARFVGHSGIVLSVACLPQNGLLLTGGVDRTLRLWDIATVKEVAQFPHADWVTCAAFSMDGKKALSGTRDKFVSLWQL